MALNFRKLLAGLNIVPKTASTANSKGDLDVTDSTGKLNYHNGTTASPMVTEAHAATLTNKTIDADANTITNIENADIKAGAAIDAAKIANGTISNTEFQQLNGVTSSVVGISDTQVLTNKTIDADLNTLSNIEDADIKAGAAIDASKIADGSVSNTEFQFINTLSSNVQTQINNHTGASSGVHGVVGTVVGTSDSQVLTNKTIDADSNTITNIENADIKASAAIDAAKIANGTVSNAEFQRLDGILSAAVGISDSQVLTNKDIDGGTASNTSRITVPKASKATLDGLTRKEATIAFASDEDRLYFDDGTSLRPVGSGSGGLVNLVNLNSAWQPLDTDSVDAETSVGNWAAYADAAAVQPVDMTGGSPNTTITRTTTAGEILNGAASFEITVSSGATRQGEGVSKLCYIPLGYRGKQVSLEMPFTLSGTISEDDFRLYAYDVTNSVLITPFTYGKVLGTAGRLGASFSIPSNCEQLRVGLHIARAVNTGAVSIYLDDIYLGTKDVSVGLAGSNTIDVSSSVSFSALGTVSGTSAKVTRNGDRAYFEIRTTTGTPTGSNLEIILPPTIQIDSSKIGSTTDGTVVGHSFRGAGAAFASTSSGPFPLFYDGTTTSRIFLANTTSGGSGQTFAKGAGSTFGTGNAAVFKFDLPIAGWDANVTMAESSSFRISSYLANGTRVTATPTALGQWRTRSRSASSATLNDNAPTTGPSASDGMRIFNRTWGSAEVTGSPEEWQIFVGKNKQIKTEWYASAGRTGFLNPDVYNWNGSSAEPSGVLQDYDPTTGVLRLLVNISSGGTTAGYVGTTGIQTLAANGYFDVVVSENALAVGVQAPRSQVFAQNANGAGSTRTSIRRFTNSTTVGTAITYSDSATNGAEFLINENGVYAISWAARATAANDMAITKNQTADFAVAVGSMAAGSFTDGTVLKSGTEAGANVTTSCDTTCILSAGDVIRFMAAGSDDGSPRFCSARITKVSN